MFWWWPMLHESLHHHCYDRLALGSSLVVQGHRWPRHLQATSGGLSILFKFKNPNQTSISLPLKPTISYNHFSTRNLWNFCGGCSFWPFLPFCQLGTVSQVRLKRPSDPLKRYIDLWRAHHHWLLEAIWTTSWDASRWNPNEDWIKTSIPTG